MPARNPFEYVVVRVVSRAEREEFINVGVVLYCRALRYLAARVALDRQRLAAFAPQLDADAIQAQLDLIAPICADPLPYVDLSKLDQAERFRWLAAPKSTLVQVSPVHIGLCDDPATALDELFERLVQ